MIIGFYHRKGFYIQDDLQVFNRGERGGRYWFTGGLNWRAAGPWLLGAAIGLLGSRTRRGSRRPGTDLLDGADIGFSVAAVIMATFTRSSCSCFPEPRNVFRDYYDEDPNEVFERRTPDGPRLVPHDLDA